MSGFDPTRWLFDRGVACGGVCAVAARRAWPPGPPFPLPLAGLRRPCLACDLTFRVSLPYDLVTILPYDLVTILVTILPYDLVTMGASSA